MTSLPSRACPKSEPFLLSFYACDCAHLGEKRCPYGLDLFDLGGSDEGLELVGLRTLVSLPRLQLRDCPYSDVDAVIREDEGSVGRGELGGRHGDCRSVVVVSGDVPDEVLDAGWNIRSALWRFARALRRKISEVPTARSGKRT